MGRSLRVGAVSALFRAASSQMALTGRVKLPDEWRPFCVGAVRRRDETKAGSSNRFQTTRSLWAAGRVRRAAGQAPSDSCSKRSRPFLVLAASAHWLVAADPTPIADVAATHRLTSGYATASIEGRPRRCTHRDRIVRFGRGELPNEVRPKRALTHGHRRRHPSLRMPVPALERSWSLPEKGPERRLVGADEATLRVHTAGVFLAKSPRCLLVPFPNRPWLKSSYGVCQFRTTITETAERTTWSSAELMGTGPVRRGRRGFRRSRRWWCGG